MTRFIKATSKANLGVFIDCEDCVGGSEQIIDALVFRENGIVVPVSPDRVI